MRARFWLRICLSLPLLPLTPAMCAGSLDPAREPQVIPQPREIETGCGPFRLSGITRMVVASNDREDRSAAQMFVQELKEVAGLQTPVTTEKIRSTSLQILLGRFTDPSVKALLQSRQLSTESVGDEGYILDVTPQMVLVAGKDSPGLFYGIQTLKQLIVPSSDGWGVLAVHMRDWPALERLPGSGWRARSRRREAITEGQF